MAFELPRRMPQRKCGTDMSSKSISRSAASVVSFFILYSLSPAFAAIKDKKTSPDKFAYTTVVVKNGKKQKSYVVACLNKTPGKAYTKKKKTYFRPLKTDELNARVQALRSPTKKNKQKKNKKIVQ